MKKKIYLGNAFSLQMLDLAQSALVKVEPVEISEVAEADFISVVGHTDTAKVVSGLLGREVKFNRVSVKLEEGDTLYVAQVTGGRLPEGATELPEGMSLTFLKVSFPAAAHLVGPCHPGCSICC